jgi:hypothetical protein
MFGLTSVSAAIAEPAVDRLDSFGEWTLYADGETPHRFCFITSEPRSSMPTGASRDAPRAYVSAWPNDGVKTEISFRMGFPVKSSVPGAARISPVSFALFGAKDRLYVGDPTQELKLVEAMKKGTDVSIEATSERGTVVTDEYSLNGLGQALQKLRENCP